MNKLEVVCSYRNAKLDSKKRVTIREFEIEQCGFKDNAEVIMCKYKDKKALLIVPVQED